jgi:hypothetical protein
MEQKFQSMEEKFRIGSIDQAEARVTVPIANSQ